MPNDTAGNGIKDSGSYKIIDESIEVSESVFKRLMKLLKR